MRDTDLEAALAPITIADERLPEWPEPAATSAASPPRTLADIFTTSARRWPDRPALAGPDATYTYAELQARATELAERLHASGIGAGDDVVVRIQSGTAELYLAILGVLLAGAAYVPIDVDDPPARAADILARSGACAEIVDGLALKLIGSAQHAHRQPAFGPAVNNDAWVIFTSGSTGRPKGVAVSHRAAAAFVDGEARLWHVEPEDRVLAGLSVGFDASCEEIWLAWRNGATLVPAPRAVVRAGEELGTWLIQQRITVVSTVPTLAAMWDESCLHDVRLLILGGEACPEPLGWRLAAGREVWNTYGPTEATVVSTAAAIVSGEPVTIGRPLPGWEIAVVEDGREVEPGTAGELVIGGVGLARYLDGELDRERYAPLDELGWERAYRTGDIVREGPAGIEFIGRRDGQVKIGGRRIELGEVESALAQQPGVRAAAVAVQTSSAGNKLLVGYVVARTGDDGLPPAATELRAALAQKLPAGLVPLIAFIPELPLGSSGKVDRRALPWPVGGDASALAAGIGADGGPLSELEQWVGEHWIEQLGPVPITAAADFFALGGTSLAAAKLTSVVRHRYPALAVADLYRNPTLRAFGRRLERLGPRPESVQADAARPRRAWAVGQLLAVFALICLGVPTWLLMALAVDRWYGVGPQLSWPIIIGAMVVIGSPPVRALTLIGARRAFLAGVTPGRYPRRGSVAIRIMTLDRLAARAHFANLSGTPWAARYARLCGQDVGVGADLGTIPPLTSMVSVGAGATIEPEADIQGWWIEGAELVIDRIEIGAGARIGARALLMPGTRVGAGAEIEPGTVISGEVPAGQRWEGVPAAHVGEAGERWPAGSAPQPSRRARRLWRGMFMAGVVFLSLFSLLAAVPAIVMFVVLVPNARTIGALVQQLDLLAPAFAVVFTLSDALMAALVSRALAPSMRTGYQPAFGRARWALWLQHQLLEAVQSTIFPVYASSFTRRWLRLCGVAVGRRTEVSVGTGLSALTTLGDASFAADAVQYNVGRCRGGWLHVAPVAVGSRTFLGNGAIVPGGARLGDSSLIGVMTVAPETAQGGTSWLGTPALELPRRPQTADPARTFDPPLRLRVARRLVDIVRIVLPATLTTIVGSLLYGAIVETEIRRGVVAMIVATPFLTVLAGIVAVLATIALKWIVIGRYRAGDHPLFSLYVWRDEIMNSLQEMVSGPWLMNMALGTPLLSLYLRLMGAKVGRDVWVENMNTTEFDLVQLGDGCAINRASVVQTHLFQDRVMSTGPSSIGRDATLGPESVVLPDTIVGAGTVIGQRSIVLRGEELPAGTRWHGAPVTPE